MRPASGEANHALACKAGGTGGPASGGKPKAPKWPCHHSGVSLRVPSGRQTGRLGFRPAEELGRKAKCVLAGSLCSRDTNHSVRHVGEEEPQ